MAFDIKIGKKKLTKEQEQAIEKRLHKYTKGMQEQRAWVKNLENQAVHGGVGLPFRKELKDLLADMAEKRQIDIGNILNEIRSDSELTKSFSSLHSNTGREYLEMVRKKGPIPEERLPNFFNSSISNLFSNIQKLPTQLQEDEIKELREIKAINSKIYDEIRKSREERDAALTEKRQRETDIEDKDKEIAELKIEAVVRTTAILSLKKIKTNRFSIPESELLELMDNARFRDGKINFSAIGRALGCTHETAKRLLVKRGMLKNN